jgi:hypothetical protein
MFARFASAVTLKQIKRAERNLAEGRTRDSLRAFDKLTTVVDGEPRFISNLPREPERARRPRQGRDLSVARW